MDLNIRDAYNYYVSNTDKSCNKTIIDYDQFRILFPRFIEEFCTSNLTLDLNVREFVDMTDFVIITNCGNAKVLKANNILLKINEWKKQQS